MKLLLTSGGITNMSISDALVDMLGKPTAESTALCVPTAQWGYPRRVPVSVPDFLTGRAWGGMTTMEWKSLGVLELSTLPTIGAERWIPWVQEADVLLVAGGEATYLCHWIRESGLADLLPSLIDKVWVGVSIYTWGLREAGIESEQVGERNEAGRVARNQSLMGLECHAEFLGFYSEALETHGRVEQRRDRVQFEY